MAKKLVLIGGGHAHLITLANIRGFVAKNYRVTVIGPSEYHYYSGMGPGMLGGTYALEDIRFHTRKVVEDQGGSFILDKVVGIDPVKKQIRTMAGHAIPYDVLSCNAGSQIKSPDTDYGVAGNVFSVKPIEKLNQARKEILTLIADRTIEIAIIGGGPSSAEIAGNINQLAGNAGGYRPNIKIFAGNSLMGRLPDKVGKLVRNSLTRRKIEIIEGGHAHLIDGNTIELDNGDTFGADLIFLATGVHPSPIFAESGLPVGPDGGLLVNRYLQSDKYPEIFGGGDCIYFENQPLDKVGVYAVRQNPVLYHNLLAALEGGPLREFEPKGSYLLIFNLGDGDGVFHKYRVTFGGKFAFIIKDFIDRKFMRRFQSLEKESSE